MMSPIKVGCLPKDHRSTINSWSSCSFSKKKKLWIFLPLRGYFSTLRKSHQSPPPLFFCFPRRSERLAPCAGRSLARALRLAKVGTSCWRRRRRAGRASRCSWRSWWSSWCFGPRRAFALGTSASDRETSRWRSVGREGFFCSCHGENGLDGKVGAVCRLVFLRGFLFKVGVKGTPKECNYKFDGRCPYFQKHPYHGRWVWFSSMSWKEPCKPAQVLGV